MDDREKKLREDIELLFKNARTEGALRKWADGQRDAEEVISLIVDKLTVMGSEERIRLYNSQDELGLRMWDPVLCKAQLQHTIKEIKE